MSVFDPMVFFRTNESVIVPRSVTETLSVLNSIWAASLIGLFILIMPDNLVGALFYFLFMIILLYGYLCIIEATFSSVFYYEQLRFYLWSLFCACGIVYILSFLYWYHYLINLVPPSNNVIRDALLWPGLFYEISKTSGSVLRHNLLIWLGLFIVIARILFQDSLET